MANKGKKMKTTVLHDDWLMAQLADAEFAAEYLNAANDDDDPKSYLTALRKVVEARGGMASVADKAELSRETLYRTPCTCCTSRCVRHALTRASGNKRVGAKYDTYNEMTGRNSIMTIPDAIIAATLPVIARSKATRQSTLPVIARSAATRQSTLPRHCEERSDVAIQGVMDCHGLRPRNDESRLLLCADCPG